MPKTDPHKSVPIVDGIWLPMSTFATSTTPISIVREDGLMLFSNQALCDHFRIGMRPEQLTGANIRDGGPLEFFNERIELLHELARKGKHGVIRDLWRGQQFLTHVLLLPRLPGETLRRFLILNLRVQGEAPPSIKPDRLWFSPDHQDLGLLALLSRRELEVLALLGQGLGAPLIAKALHRSEDTINTHKAALLRKLSCANSTQLAMVAQRAGLTREDAERFKP